MSFKKGNKFAKGGRRPGAGAKSKAQVEEKKQAEVIAREMLEAEVRPIMQTYLRLAAGGITAKGIAQTVIKHAVDKFLPPKFTARVEHSLDREALEALQKTPEGRELTRRLAGLMVGSGGGGGRSSTQNR